MKRLIGMFAALCLLLFLPDSRLLAAAIGGALGLLLGGVIARATLRALGVEHRLRAASLEAGHGVHHAAASLGPRSAAYVSAARSCARW